MRHGAFVAMLIPIFVIFGAAMPISDSSIEAASIGDLNEFDWNKTNKKGAFFDRRNGVSGSDPSVLSIA
ncbi:hypothetical protein BGW80DRAFT_1460009 [Lactifluus volemus]|nr:hypothetical protein BGW80DRAFT_1460009 [Lactifluus volemus]